MPGARGKAASSACNSKKAQRLAITEKFTIIHKQGECVDIFPIYDRINISDQDCMSYEDAMYDLSLNPTSGISNGANDTKWFCKEDPIMNHYLKKMHDDLKYGLANSQVMIDRSLVSCWIAKKHPQMYCSIPNEARLLHPSVTYHHSTLPDIGRFISQSLIQKDWKSNLILNVICNSIPCLKRNRVAFLPAQSFVHPYSSVLVNLLHGLLMGLYPNTAKKPSFHQRVRCASELRRIMTSSLQQQADFLYSNLNLLKLAMMEYVWYACNHFLVTEKEVICNVQGMQTFFDICPNVADAFRQETLQKDWTWERLDEVALMCVDRCVRTCKFRSGRNSPSKDTIMKWKRINDDMDHLFDAAKEMHCVNVNGLLWKIYHEQYPDLTVEDFHIIDHIHSRCKVYPLPCNLTAMQCSTLLKRFSADHFQMDNMMKVHICLKCCNKLNGFTVSSKLRLCMQTNELRCASCGLKNSIVSVNMLGKILVIQGTSYILCPCCGMFKRWNYTGNEFTKPCEFYNQSYERSLPSSSNISLNPTRVKANPNAKLIKNGKTCCPECKVDQEWQDLLQGVHKVWQDFESREGDGPQRKVWGPGTDISMRKAHAPELYTQVCGGHQRPRRRLRQL